MMNYNFGVITHDFQPCFAFSLEKRGADKKYSLSILARKNGVRASVLICCVGSSIEELESSEKHIPTALGIAEELLDSSSDNSVYLYVIEKGQVNLEPEVFSSHESAIHGLRKMYPARMPKHIKLNS